MVDILSKNYLNILIRVPESIQDAQVLLLKLKTRDIDDNGTDFQLITEVGTNIKRVASVLTYRLDGNINSVSVNRFLLIDATESDHNWFAFG